MIRFLRINLSVVTNFPAKNIAHNCFLSKHLLLNIYLDQHFNQNAFFFKRFKLSSPTAASTLSATLLVTAQLSAITVVMVVKYALWLLCLAGASFYWNRQNAKHMIRYAQAESSDTTQLPAVNTRYRPKAAEVTARWQHTQAVVVVAFPFIELCGSFITMLCCCLVF